MQAQQVPTYLYPVSIFGNINACTEIFKVANRRRYKNTTSIATRTNQEILSSFGFDIHSRIDVNLRDEIISLLKSKGFSTGKDYLNGMPEDIIQIISKSLNVFELVDLMSTSKSSHKTFRKSLAKTNKILVTLYRNNLEFECKGAEDHLIISAATVPKLIGTKELFLFKKYTPMKLGSLKKLRFLTISKCGKQNSTVASAKNLKILRVWNTAIKIKTILKKQNLEHIQLVDCCIDPYDYIKLCSLPKLKHVYIKDHKLTEDIKKMLCFSKVKFEFAEISEINPFF